MPKLPIHRGSCLCGGVAFEIAGALRPVVACHCGQCRKTSGHYWAATQVPSARLRLTCEETLSWFRSSGSATRGFCSACGSSLFWKHDDEDALSIGAGTLDTHAADLAVERHIFVKDKGAYYALNDGLPQS